MRDVFMENLFTEAKKLVYEDRAKYYADPNFSKIPLETLLSKDYANERSKLISLPLLARAAKVKRKASVPYEFIPFG